MTRTDERRPVIRQWLRTSKLQGERRYENRINNIEGTVLIISSLNYVRMLIFVMTRSDLKLDNVGSKTTSLGQILEKTLCTLKSAQF